MILLILIIIIIMISIISNQYLGGSELKSLLISYINNGLIDMEKPEIEKYINKYGKTEVINMLTEIICIDNKIKLPLKKQVLTLEKINSMFYNLQNYKFITENKPFIIKNIYFTPLGKKLFPINYMGKYISFIAHKQDYYNIDIITDYFTEKQRLQAQRKDTELSIYNAWQDSASVKKILEYIIEHNMYPINAYTLRESIYANFKECTQFKTTLAYSCYKYFGATRILDISAGWGDRLIAAIAYGAEKYLAFDPNINLRKGHNKIIEMFGNSTAHKIIYEPFQTGTFPVNFTCDLIFTSPPFFDFEIYTNLETQSVKTFPKLNDWLVGFLFESLKKAWSVLVTNGYMVIHITDVYNVKCCEAMCAYVVANLENSYYCGVISAVGTESAGRHRPIWVYQKRDKDYYNNERQLAAGILKKLAI